MNRRDFLLKVWKCSVALGFAKGVYEIFRPVSLEASATPIRWAFLVDTQKCIGCGFCVKACKLENDIPFNDNVSRTWVERYVVTKDGDVFADSPKEARNGFINGRIDLGHGKSRDIAGDNVDKAFFVPKLCNQCEKPPCVQVCPVGATYQVADGVVLVDRKWCIGCGYCIMACPYGMRFFHPRYHVAEKCNFCYHRINKGMEPACVMACPVGARRIGNLKKSRDPVATIIKTGRVSVHKPEYGTSPQVYFIGLSYEVR
jgi:Fe-S-cluster-containing dehydrogenase component